MSTHRKITWEAKTCFTVGGTRFDCLPDTLSGAARRADAPGLLLLKTRRMVDDYATILAAESCPCVVEVGTFTGASAMFFQRLLEPERLVTMDLRPSLPLSLTKLVEANGLASVVHAHAGVDQADVRRVRSVLDASVGSRSIDLVVDDASHAYAPTRACFEILFPRMRAGGLYVIEDWCYAEILAQLAIDAITGRDFEGWERREWSEWTNAGKSAALETGRVALGDMLTRPSERWRLTATRMIGALLAARPDMVQKLVEPLIEQAPPDWTWSRMANALRDPTHCDHLEAVRFTAHYADRARGGLRRPLSAFVSELALMTACRSEIVERLVIHSWGVVAIRGAAVLDVLELDSVLPYDLGASAIWGERQ